jgi:hypothetical protein
MPARAAGQPDTLSWQTPSAGGHGQASCAAAADCAAHELSHGPAVRDWIHGTRPLRAGRLEIGDQAARRAVPVAPIFIRAPWPSPCCPLPSLPARRPRTRVGDGRSRSGP